MQHISFLQNCIFNAHLLNVSLNFIIFVYDLNQFSLSFEPLLLASDNVLVGTQAILTTNFFCPI